MAGKISSPDFHKHQRYKVGDTHRKDFISNLPDCVLVYILSLLPTKVAVGTSVLAKRWKYLWTYLSVFDFELYCSIFNNKETKIQKSANCIFDLVNRPLQRSNSAKKLRIVMSGNGISIDADKFLSFITDAVEHKVEDLHISLVLNTTFVLPHCFSTSVTLRNLCLKLGCVLYVPSGLCFPSLKTLNISCTFANDTSLQRLFSACVVLQELTLFCCNWKNIKRISVAMPTLRRLTIYFQPFSPDDLPDSTVTIDAVNLLSFSCTSYLTIEFVLVNLTSVDYAYIDVGNYFASKRPYAASRAIKLLSGLDRVKYLMLSSDTLQALSHAKDKLHRLPLFNNLTHLDVNLETSKFTSETLMDILQKTPKLEVLDIPKGFDPQVCLDGEEWKLNSVPFCFKSSLRLFCIYSFKGDAAEIQLLKFMLKNAIVLRNIQLFCSESLSSDLKKQADIRNQLHSVGLGSCVITFEDEDDLQEA